MTTQDWLLPKLGAKNKTLLNQTREKEKNTCGRAGWVKQSERGRKWPLKWQACDLMPQKKLDRAGVYLIKCFAKCQNLQISDHTKTDCCQSLRQKDKTLLKQTREKKKYSKPMGFSFLGLRSLPTGRIVQKTKTPVEILYNWKSSGAVLFHTPV